MIKKREATIEKYLDEVHKAKMEYLTEASEDEIGKYKAEKKTRPLELSLVQ